MQRWLGDSMRIICRVSVTSEMLCGWALQLSNPQTGKTGLCASLTSNSGSSIGAVAMLWPSHCCQCVPVGKQAGQSAEMLHPQIGSNTNEILALLSHCCLAISKALDKSMPVGGVTADV